MNRISAIFASQQAHARVASAAWIAWIILIGIPLRAESQTPPPDSSPSRDWRQAGPAAEHKNSRVVVHHVALGGPNGVLMGRVVDPCGDPGARHPPSPKGDNAVANLRVALLHNGHAMALTRTDRSGRFALTNLSPGRYQVLVDTPKSATCLTCRVWAPSSAPPTARHSVDLMLGEGIVRGQGPFPILSFPQAAALTGVVGGAIAAPVIYHNVKTANRGPSSP